MTIRKWKVLGKTKGNIIQTLFVNRGIKTEKNRKEFLNPRLEDASLKSTGIDPVAVRKTIKRIGTAVKKNEKIIIYGDYDVDGITGTAILWETLFLFYKNVMPYIPHRVEEGYGLSIAGIQNLESKIQNVGLIITVDNGIVANDEVEYANKKGIDIIITDHHVSGKKLPRAYSIVHTTKLCGAGVAYLLSKEIKKNHESRIMNQGGDNHLELVALATVADLVPLMGANRTLVKFGIESLRKTKRLGLLALLESAQIKKEDIDVYKIGHIIAPRLNATGRIAHAMDSLRLLCTKDILRARKLASHLSDTNQTRQLLTKESTDHADLISEQIDLKQKFIFVGSNTYNQGIIGLVASRLVEKHYRPTVVVSIGDDISKGSARSVAGFNIIEYLRTFSSYLIDAGGHPMAAGFTIETHRIEEFRKALIKSSAKLINSDLLERVLKIDLEIRFDQIDENLYSEIQKLAPFGMGNPEPVFVSRNVKVEGARFVGQENKHLKIQLSQNGKMLDAIYFNGVESGINQGDNIDVVYSIEQDTWSGNKKIQLKIKDVERNPLRSE